MSPRALRIGVVLGGQLVEDRVVRGGAAITLGQSLRATISLPVDGVPPLHELVAWRDGHFVLRVTEAMDGRLRQGDATRTFDELRRGPASDGAWEAALAPGARCKLSLGEATVLLQEVALPVLARPRLPASVRGTLADRIDRRLALIVGGSLALHFAIAAWAWSTDTDLGVLGEPPIEAAQYQPETIDTIDLAPAPVVPAPGVAAPATPAQTPRPIVAHPVAPRPADRDDAVRFASILTSSDEQPGGSGDMQPRHPGADLARQIEDARDHRVAIGGDRTSRTDDRARIGTGRDPTLADPTFDRTAHRDAEVVRVRIAPTPVTTEDPTSLTPEVVLAKLRDVYMKGLERCYRRALTEDENLSGKIALTFTVESHGRVTDPEAAGMGDKIDACVAQQMSAWHFPAPRDRDGAPTDATFHVSLALRPS
ncbi:MAG TPA: AgmX/PglI C-terminal domain-containing protein [Kofleriaceae bacterium]|nr:AgmX/PglI C-terminal domain-containing protein [Kofleriaceae bacterium]